MEIVGGGVVATIKGRNGCDERAVQQVCARVETSNGRIVGIAIRTANSNWLREDSRSAVVEEFGVEANVTAIKFFRNVGLDLAAIVAVISNITRAFAVR